MGTEKTIIGIAIVEPAGCAAPRAVRSVHHFRLPGMTILSNSTMMAATGRQMACGPLTVTHMPNARIIAWLIFLLADSKVGTDLCSARHSSNWNEKQEGVIGRILASATALVESYAPDAPEAIQNEAVIRVGGFLGFLYDSPPGASMRFANPLGDSGAQVPESNIALRTDVSMDVISALGIPPSLFRGTDGPSAREAYRLLLVSTLTPIADLIADELSRKLETTVTLGFKRLHAADIQSRARAFGSMVAAGIEEQTALELSGLDG